LKGLPCDVFLAPHGSFFGLSEKTRRLGNGSNPFIDPKGYREFIRQSEEAFEERLQLERSRERERGALGQ